MSEPAPTVTEEVSMWLIAEFTPGHIYSGWHLYLRESSHYQTRNTDGGWGWIRWPKERRTLQTFLATMGCEITGDGTCDYDGICRFAKLFPLAGRKIGGKRRGGVIVMTQDGVMRLSSPKTE